MIQNTWLYFQRVKKTTRASASGIIFLGKYHHLMQAVSLFLPRRGGLACRLCRAGVEKLLFGVVAWRIPFDSTCCPIKNILISWEIVLCWKDAIVRRGAVFLCVCMCVCMFATACASSHSRASPFSSKSYNWYYYELTRWLIQRAFSWMMRVWHIRKELCNSWLEHLFIP